MRNSLNFDKTLPYLTTLTPMKPPFCTFWFYLIPKSVFEVFIADLYVVVHVNTPVTLVLTFIKSVGRKMPLSMIHRNQVNQFANANV